MSAVLVYYSTYTKIAYDINERYYKGVHYAYCCPFFFKDGHPGTSTPKRIYADLAEAAKSGDKHNPKIRENIAGILKGAGIKLKLGLIDQVQYDEINYILTVDWQYAYFNPIIFVIPSTTEVEAIIKKVPIHERASPLSDELKIEELERRHFDVISFSE